MLKLRESLRRIKRDESGAVTVDWVALTAGILLLGIAVVYAVFRQGVSPLVSAISTELAALNPAVSIGDPPFGSDSSDGVESDTLQETSGTANAGGAPPG